jgi:hypothetical protein
MIPVPIPFKQKFARGFEGILKVSECLYRTKNPNYSLIKHAVKKISDQAPGNCELLRNTRDRHEPKKDMTNQIDSRKP